LKYPLNKCGSCEGCWFKTQEIIPDDENVKKGICPAYHAIELKIGRVITIKHWTDGVIYAGTIIELDSLQMTLECSEITLFIGLSNIYEYMNVAYDALLK